MLRGITLVLQEARIRMSDFRLPFSNSRWRCCRCLGCPRECSADPCCLRRSQVRGCAGLRGELASGNGFALGDPQRPRPLPTSALCALLTLSAALPPRPRSRPAPAMRTAALKMGELCQPRIFAPPGMAAASMEVQAKAERAIASNNYDTDAWTALLAELQACGPRAECQRPSITRLH